MHKKYEKRSNNRVDFRVKYKFRSIEEGDSITGESIRVQFTMPIKFALTERKSSN
jgi:hypothetical protein